MNWDALGAMAEVLGAAGVVASLVYLAGQIRTNTRAVRAATHQQTNNAVREWELHVAGNAETFEIFQRGVADLSVLSPSEHGRFGFIIDAALRDFQNQLYQYRTGFLDESQFDAFRENLRNLVCTPGVAQWWRTTAFGFGPEFRAEVDQLIAESGAPAA